ncbi:MAG: two-component regulator propeller domain-containing protein [Flavobacteriaceae bacterium]
MKQKVAIYVYLLFPLLIVGQNTSPKFNHLTLENGLSQSSITCILKDSEGFMWFGTEDGLNKYDGTEFSIYSPVPNKINSISSGKITAIVEQGEGIFWIGTENGLNYFNSRREVFTTFYNKDSTSSQSGKNRIRTLKIIAKDRLLAGTGDGLYWFDMKKRVFEPAGSLLDPSENEVLDMVLDENDRLWVLGETQLLALELGSYELEEVYFEKVLKSAFHGALLLDLPYAYLGTANGLMRIHIKTKEWRRFKFYETEEIRDSRNSVLSLIEGEGSILWLGTSSGGLIKFDRQTEEFQAFNSDAGASTSLNSNSVKSLFLDDQKILWVGTYGGGINMYDGGVPSFEHYKHHPGTPDGLSENSVRSVLLDSKKNLWVGTHGGLDRFKRKSGKLIRHSQPWEKEATAALNTVRTLCEDKNGTVWAGTWLNGLIRFSGQSQNSERLYRFPGRTDSIGQVRALIGDDKGNIWIGANGLWKYSPKTQQHLRYVNKKGDLNSLSSSAVNNLFFDASGMLWIGTQEGLNSLDPNSGKIIQYLADATDSLSLAHNYVTSMAEDKRGGLWVGTYGGGLHVLNRDSQTFYRHNTSNGLQNDVIYGVLIDEHDFVWFSSNSGLGRLDPSTKEITYFNEIHGIQSNEFNAGAYYKSASGEFFFGGINGLNAFYPDSISSARNTHNIVLTDFRLLDKKDPLGTRLQLEKHLSQIKQLELPYHQNTFRLKFSELNYSSAADNDYEYWLEGLDEHWKGLGKRQTITLANLKPGSYKLHLRVVNDESKETVLAITISKPIWLTNWAYLAYGLTLLAILMFGVRHHRRIKKSRIQFEERIRDLENDLRAPEIFTINGGAEPVLQLKKVGVVSRNQKLLERAVEIVEKYMEDSSFGVEMFINEMYMSRSQLHRKLKTLTGCSTTEFIRLIRLKRAAQLLKGKAGTVAEISYKVGFDNVGYFSRCFKETFGCPPSQYLG